MSLSRRDFLAAVTAAAPAAVGMPFARGSEAHDFPRGKAEHCIFIWLGGGAAQIDTWDPKQKGDAKAGKAGSYYDAIPTAVAGVEVCAPLPRCAAMLDRFAVLRTVHHGVIDEHARATNQVHTGRPTAGTITYPSIGSAVSYTRGSINDRVPAYILIGYPNVTRGPGFLGAEAGYVYLTDTRVGPAGFARQPEITDARQRRREALLDEMRSGGRDPERLPAIVADYDAASRQAFRMAGPDFMNLFNLSAEPGSLRDEYGGEFGQRLLLSRRLVEGGVRFVQVTHGGWDHHANLGTALETTARQVDRPIAGLLGDLADRGLLEETLVIWGGEFGRTPHSQGADGRDHNNKGFTLWMAGGGVKGGMAYGATDDYGYEAIEKRMHIHDWHATLLHLLGLDHERLTYPYAGRDFRLTDVHGAVAREIIA